MQLVNVPKPKFNEGLRSFLFRLKQHTGYRHGWLMSRLGLRKLDERDRSITMLNINRYSLVQLSKDTGEEVEMLLDLTFTATHPDLLKDYVISKISPKRIFNTKLKICPFCTKEDQYVRKHWELLLVTTCPTHQCLLIDNCPNCKSEISQENLEQCRHCKTNFIDNSGIELGAHLDEVHLSKLLIEKAYLIESDHLLLGHLNFVELHKLFFMLLLESDNNLTLQSKYAVINEFTIEVIHPIMIRIMNLFSEWPFRFHDFLKHYKSKRKSSRQEGVDKDFGSFYSVLYSSFEENQFDFLRNEFENYITQHWTGGHVSRFTRISKQSSKYISAAKAFRNYGINGINICRLIDQGLIRGKFIEKNSSKIILIEETSLISYVNKLSGTLPSYQAAEYLGISEYTLLDLLEHKCITAFRGPLVDGYSHWHYEKEIIDGMLIGIDQKIVPLDQEIDERVLKFRTIVQNSKYPCKTGEFVKLILEGKIRPCDKTDGIGFTTYLFREKDISNYFSVEMNKSKSILSINEVSHILKLKREEINKLIRAGLLPGACKGKGKRSVISRDDLESFMGKYISLSEITRGYQSNVRFLLMNFVRHGGRHLTTILAGLPGN
ncbi:TniQ family protein [Paenibacillus sp. Soil787]|uniref:TniQ family protein n=1 Tax=Paenibacillus sp. Soil787 TaxID=1736411 RepID=UPI0007024C1D|nr:TniQ family protein [Paenibacillus sp. Soil787]KRF19356.1 hypothetical protein ASG93_32330 [Paenibacillus sp. Soil787]